MVVEPSQTDHLNKSLLESFKASVDRMVAGDQQWRPGMPPPSMGGAAGGTMGPSVAARGPSARLSGGQPGSGPGSPGQVREVGGLVREHVEFV